MKEIGKRLWREPVYLGTVLIGGVSMAAGMADLDGLVVASIATFIALVTGATVRQRVSPPAE